MSRKLVTLVYERKIGSLLKKAVLSAMADRANDDGTGVWLSKGRIADEIEASRRAVITAIQEMVADGLLIDHGLRAAGSTHHYDINVSVLSALERTRADKTGCENLRTPEQDANPAQICAGDVNPVHRGREHSSHKPSFNRPLTTEAIASVERASAPPPAIPEQPKRAGSPKSGARGSRIAPNWTPTPKDYAFASSEGLTREEINREADRFRDYWNAATGRNAAKLDWEGTWRNWVRRVSDDKRKRDKARASYQRGGAEQTLSAFDRVAASLAGHAPRPADPVQPDAGTIEGEYWPAETRTGTGG